MNEEEQKKLEEENKKKANQENDYLKSIEDIKKNYVKKDLFDEEHKKRVDAEKALVNVLDGEEQARKEKEQEEQPKLDYEKTIKKLYTNNDNVEMTNYEFMKNTLAVREECIKKHGRDPFLGVLKNNKTPSYEDQQEAERYAKGLQDIIDECDKNCKTDQEKAKMFNYLYDMRVN